MPAEPFRHRVPPSATVEHVQRLAEYWAQQHGLDAERLHRLLEKLAVGTSDGPLPAEAARSRGRAGALAFSGALHQSELPSGDHGFLPCFGEALQQLAAERALALFENMSPLALWQRSTLFH